MEIFSAALVFIWGAIIGSFLNVVILRLPQEESLGGRSHCPKCGRVLGSMDLVPLVSFLALKGKCRTCGHSISWRYFTVEAITGMLFVLAWLVLEPVSVPEFLIFFRAIFVLSVLVVVFAIDFDHYLILDKVLFPSGVVLLLSNGLIDLLSGSKLWSTAGYFGGGILAGAAAALPFFLIWYVSRGRWMGFGDVKFMAVMGLVLGWPHIWVAWFLSFFLGSVFSVFLLAFGQKTMASKLPFGTFLSIATVIALLWGEGVVNWYLSILMF